MFPALLAQSLDALFVEKELDAAAIILDMAKGEAALFAPGHQTAGDSDLLAIELLEF